MNLKTLKLIVPAKVYDEAIAKYKSANKTGSFVIHKTTCGAPNVERLICNELFGKKAGAGYSSPVSIHIHSFRKKLADADGISAKAVIDGLRHCGILSDDTTKEIEEIQQQQTKIEDQEEYTLIHIFSNKQRSTK